MAATIIQIKRSSATATPASLANGELAFSGGTGSNSLFVGEPSSGTPIRIGGGKYAFLHQAVQGTWTANAVQITDSNNFVSNVISQGLYLGPTVAAPGGIAVTTINAVANSTALGTPSNTELTTTWAIKTYVDDKVAGVSGSATPGGANTQIQFNDSSSFNGSAGFTFDKTVNNVSLANTLFVGNSTINVVVNNSVIKIANSTVSANLSQAGLVVGTSTVNSTAVAAGANVILNTTNLLIGNSTVNLSANSVLLSLTNSTATANLSQIGLIVGITTANATTLAVGANVFMNSSTLSIGNSTVNSLANSSLIATTGKVGVGTAAPSVTLTVVGTDGIQVPVGNTSQRPTGNTGLIRYNSDANNVEIYANSNWFPIQKGWQGTAISTTPIIEDAGTNIVLQSEDLTQAAWTAANATISVSGVEDIFGATAAQLITPSVSANASVRQAVSIANDNLGYVGSIYVNSNGTSQASKIQLTFSNSTANVLTYSAAFNAQTGLVTALSGTPANWSAMPLNNGWTRISVSANNNNTTANSVTFEIFPDTSNLSKTLIVYANQLEKNANLTSYIKTGAATATRAAGKFNARTMPLDSGNFTTNTTSGFSYISAVDGGTY